MIGKQGFDDDRRPHIQTLQIGLGTNGVIAGGAERVFAELAAHLPKLGVGFCGAVVFRPASQAAPEAFRYVFAPAEATIMTRLAGARRVVLEILREQSVDLIASHFSLYSLPSLDLIRKKPFVVHFHGPWAAESIEEGSGRLGAFIKYKTEKQVYSRADRVIVLSNAFSRLIQEDYGIAEERIRVVPGSVDIERFKHAGTQRQAREMLGWPLDRPILVSVRRLARRVGLDLLLAAMPRIIENFPDVLLCIGGKGEFKTRLEQQVSEFSLEQHVRFLGFVDEADLPHVYCSADFNIVPTRACEGFGLVAAEALAAGTPSLVTPVGGLPEVLENLSPDLIFHAATPEAIAEQTIQALRGTLTVPDAGECRHFAEVNFSSDVMASRTAAVYREIT